MKDDYEIAQDLARHLLLSSFVCDIGWFGGNPTIRFSSDNAPSEIWLSMPGGFEVIPSPVLPEVLSPRQRDLLLLESIHGYEVSAVQCHPDSRLQVLFANGTSLLALDNDDDLHECWELRTERGDLIVACHGGGFAVLAVEHHDDLMRMGGQAGSMTVAARLVSTPVDDLSM